MYCSEQVAFIPIEAHCEMVSIMLGNGFFGGTVLQRTRENSRNLGKRVSYYGVRLSCLMGGKCV